MRWGCVCVCVCVCVYLSVYDTYIHTHTQDLLRLSQQIGNVKSSGANATEINRLPTHKYKKKVCVCVCVCVCVYVSVYVCGCL